MPRYVGDILIYLKQKICEYHSNPYIFFKSPYVMEFFYSIISNNFCLFD